MTTKTKKKRGPKPGTKRAKKKKIDFNAVAPKEESEFQRNRRVASFNLRPYYFSTGNQQASKRRKKKAA